jgi:hypothetical protein
VALFVSFSAAVNVIDEELAGLIFQLAVAV